MAGFPTLHVSPASPRRPAAPPLAWMADASGARVWCNARWHEFTGTTPEAMRGWGWQQVHHPDHVGRVLAGIQRCAQTSDPWEDTIPLRGRDGVYRCFLARAVPVRDATGRLVRWFGTDTDVSELRAAQDAVRRSEEQLHAAKTAAGVGTRCWVPGTSHADVSEDWRRIFGASPDAEITLDAWRDLLLPEDRDRAAAALNAAHELISAAPDRVVEFHVTTMLLAWGDAALLRQVLVNLLGNALKYTGPREQALTEIGSEPREDAIVYHVRDNGVGFDMAHAQRLFGVFIRLHSEKKFPGTGVGLASVKLIVTRHGGEVWADSAPGDGATFYFTLPRENGSAGGGAGRRIPT